MGWDITYHPMAPEEIQTLYMKGMKQPDTTASEIVTQFQLSDDLIISLNDWFISLQEMEGDDFNALHGFCLASLLGLLRKYWYLRGGAFSFAVEENPVFQKYIVDWTTLLPDELLEFQVSNVLIQNYSVGCFIGPSQLKQLRSDYEQDPQVRQVMDSVFSHGRLPIFWKAVDYAIEHQLGLLEASEIFEPNPLDIEKSASKTTWDNLEAEGVALYVHTVQEQISQALAESSEEKQPKNSEPVKNTAVQKKGFWQRLFKK